MNTNQPKIICRQVTTAQLDDIVVGEIAFNVTTGKYVGRDVNGRITYIESQATTELELPTGAVATPYLEWDVDAAVWKVVANPTMLEKGSATKLTLIWNNTSGVWESKTVAEMRTALGTAAMDVGSVTDLYPQWNNSLSKYTPMPASTIATGIGAVSTLNWGNPEGGYLFDGTDDYVTVADNANLDFGTGDFSLECTFKQSASATYARLYAKYVSGQGGTSIYVEAGKVGIELSDGTSVATIQSDSAVVSNNVAYHLTTTITGRASYAMYLNGVLIASSVVGGTLATLGSLDGTGTLRFGISNSGSQPFNGLIFYTRSFNRALTQAEVTKLYNNGRPDLVSLDYADLGASQTVLTSGTLIIGKKYIIDNWITNDDFTNVGGANVDGTIFTATGTTPTTWTNSSSVRAIGCVAEYLPKHAGHYSWIETQNGLHGTATGGVTPLSNKIGDVRTAYLLTTSATPTMTDVIRAGWKVESITMTSAENLTEIDATQETSSVALLTDKMNNNTTTTWTPADHNIYPTADKDLIFTLTGNGGAGTHIYVNLKKIV